MSNSKTLQVPIQIFRIFGLLETPKPFHSSTYLKSTPGKETNPKSCWKVSSKSVTAVRLLLGGAFLNTLKLEKWCQKNRENLVKIRMLILQSKESRTYKKRGQVLKFIYSEKATKFCEIFALLLSYVVPVKSKVKISQNFVAFSEYMNFNFFA